MPPAARAGDMTAHGSPLAPGIGSPTVIIGGQPAWRAGADTSACPLSDGPKPHVGGVVVVGSTKVFINNLPAVRVGDKVVEAGAPNAITQGYLNVDIG
jgi:uncharacterized Zn-binding protein involved in type VI secretion